METTHPSANPSAANATAPTLAHALGQAALITSTQTRATFYARKNGGGLRTARKEFKCGQFGCFRVVHPGEKYFDTVETTIWPATKRICVCCSEVAI